MPIYAYVCPDCGHEFDAIQSFSDKAIRTCPQCGKKKVGKKMSASAFHLKGAGWYASDYKKSTAKDTATESKKTESKKQDDGAKAADKPGCTGAGAAKAADA